MHRYGRNCMWLLLTFAELDTAWEGVCVCVFFPTP